MVAKTRGVAEDWGIDILVAMNAAARIDDLERQAVWRQAGACGIARSRLARFQPERMERTRAMNHDGWRGTLTLHGAPGAVSGTYRTQQGQILPITAQIESANPNALDLVVPFAPDNRQRFHLVCHTWENNIFSGTTVWANRTFGVMAERTGREVRPSRRSPITASTSFQ
jgi:hypothetical protein